MNKIIYTSFSPNTSLKDLGSILFLLFQPWKYIRGIYSKKIIDMFEFRFGQHYRAFTFNYARSGMYILFKSLKLKPHDEVIVLGFTCVAAVSPILSAGCKIVYIDIDPKTLNMDLEDIKKKITSNTKVILFQYTFGNSSGIWDIKKLCEDKNLLLVEDCTHTVFGCHEDKLVGSFGSVAIFSFGSDKAVSGVDGGLILINDAKLAKEFSEQYKSLSYPSFFWVVKKLIYPVLWFVIRSLLSFLKIGKALHLVSKKLGLLTTQTTLEEKEGKINVSSIKKMPNALAHLAFSQLQIVDQLNNHRIKIKDIYDSELLNLPNNKKIVFYPGNVPLRYPILVNDKRRLINKFIKKNIYLGDWYSQPIDPRDVLLENVKYSRGSCPVSEVIGYKIINLPTHINISERDASRIAQEIKNYLEGN